MQIKTKHILTAYSVGVLLGPVAGTLEFAWAMLSEHMLIGLLNLGHILELCKLAYRSASNLKWRFADTGSLSTR